MVFLEKLKLDFIGINKKNNIKIRLKLTIFFKKFSSKSITIFSQINDQINQKKIKIKGNKLILNFHSFFNFKSEKLEVHKKAQVSVDTAISGSIQRLKRTGKINNPPQPQIKLSIVQENKKVRKM